MRSMLKQLVLHALEQQPRAGYALCTAIEKATGRRPSYGSIYPLLEKLKAEGYLTVRTDGRKKVYALTAKGKEHIATQQTQCALLVDHEMTRIKSLMNVLEMDAGPMLAMLERIKHGEPPLGPISYNMFHFRNTVFKMVQDGRVERHHQQINAMLAEATKQLEHMR